MIAAPLWSVMVPVFGRGIYLEQTLRSVVEQSPGPARMQITVVENPSEHLAVREIIAGLGRREIEHVCHPRNLGMIANWNQCVRRARGELIHILHDDDYVLPGFYQKLEAAAERRLDCGLLLARCLEIDEAGEIERLSPRLRGLEQDAHDVRELLADNGIRCPGVVVRSTAYQRVGTFKEEIPYTADWDMWFRLIKAIGAVVLNEPLAAYRCRTDNMSSQFARTGELARAHAVMAGLLAKEDERLDLAKAVSAAAWRAAFLAEDYHQRGDAEAVAANESVWREFASPRDRFRRMFHRWLRRRQ